MTDGPAADDDGGSVADARVERALAALLAIDADTAAQVRAGSRSRRRPHAQYGPQLDLGRDTGPPAAESGPD